MISLLLDLPLELPQQIYIYVLTLAHSEAESSNHALFRRPYNDLLLTSRQIYIEAMKAWLCTTFVITIDRSYIYFLGQRSSADLKGPWNPPPWFFKIRYLEIRLLWDFANPQVLRERRSLHLILRLHLQGVRDTILKCDCLSNLRVTNTIEGWNDDCQWWGMPDFRKDTLKFVLSPLSKLRGIGTINFEVEGDWRDSEQTLEKLKWECRPGMEIGYCQLWALRRSIMNRSAGKSRTVGDKSS